MNKIKKIWVENRVLLVLAIILLTCLIVFAIVSLTYFYGASDNVYGNRLDTTKNVPLNDKLFKDIKNELEEHESVTSASIKLKGKIIYINIVFVNETSMDDAKVIAESATELFNDDELAVYDIQFTISVKKTEENPGYTLMGARNSNGSGIVVWNNYTILEEGSAED